MQVPCKEEPASGRYMQVPCKEEPASEQYMQVPCKEEPASEQYMQVPDQEKRRPSWMLYWSTTVHSVLECRVCEDVFGLQGDKVPRLLYCGHTVCHACLLRLPLRDNVVQCPFDRQPTPTGNSGVWGLKKNFALLELLERLQYTQEKSTLFLTADLLEKERQASHYT
uniref:RING-type E3 ubiquitin transferase n=2 Tax=Timema TaxID=61471 RepID=A0A7R9P1A2_9NEOP|nr:unnamed protein product [Timema tahoe]